MVEMLKLTENVWAHTKGETRGNVAFVRLKNFVVMLDSGMDPVTLKDIRDIAEKETKLPVRILVNTHCHSDHVFGNRVFEDCRIISTIFTNEIMKERKQSTEENLTTWAENNPDLKEKWQNLKIVLPNETFTGRLTLDDEGMQIVIIETHGHTRGSAFIYVPSDTLIFSGDLIFSETFPYGGDPTANPYLWIEAIDIMLELRANIIIPGHGPVTSNKELELHKKYLIELTKKIEELVEQNIPKEELINRTDLPQFPYEVESGRLKMMLEQFYNVIENL
ncbi:MAG: MBL fold metallo-hydrolase [Candidatus Heimdallarchaeota archaeon]|nr:MBL fold metallo-hydrolase [Candidatus Heimdallarchaeota archaeon]